MSVIRWLEKNAMGFAELDREERSAPMHFSLIWSYFESVALNTHGSAIAIENWIRELDRGGRLRAADFVPLVNYFRQRYYDDGRFTPHFNSLNLRNNDQPELVRNVLSDKSADPVDAVVVLFIIIFRFRNNYFHGMKWAYHLRDQLENFTKANSALMMVMSM